MLELCTASLWQFLLPDNDPKKYSGPISSDFQVLYEIASGSAFIHEKGMVHRDIKPQNILLSFPDESGRVWIKVADFGCAKATNPAGSASLSKEFGGTARLLKHCERLVSHWNSRTLSYESRTKQTSSQQESSF